MNRQVFDLYTELYSKYGPQHWWPAETEYEVVVGAILTQNTNWKNVERAITNLKKEQCLTPEKILSLSKEKLEELIRPSGFFRQKAERLKKITKAWLNIDRKLDTMELRNYLLNIKGVGKETADSILLYALNKPIFVIDNYTRRLTKHFFNLEFKEYDQYREYFESNLPRDIEIYKEYHALIVVWAKENKYPK